MESSFKKTLQYPGWPSEACFQTAYAALCLDL